MKYQDQIIWKSCTPKLKMARIQNRIQPGLSNDTHTHTSFCTIFGRILQNIPANFRLQKAYVYRTLVTVQVIALSLQNSHSLTLDAHDMWLRLPAVFDESTKTLVKFESHDKKV